MVERSIRSGVCGGMQTAACQELVSVEGHSRHGHPHNTQILDCFDFPQSASHCSPKRTSQANRVTRQSSVLGTHRSCTRCQHSSHLREERLGMIFTQVYHWSQCIVQLHPARLRYLRIPGAVIFCCQDMLLGRTAKEWFSCFLQTHEAY